MSAELVKRADAIRAHYRALEAQPGSGYHDEDRNLANPLLSLAPQRTPDPGRPDPARPGKFFNLPKVSEHVVGFFDHDGDETVEFVGADAARVLAALQAARQKIDGSNPSLPGTHRKLFHRVIPSLAIETVEGLPRLSVWLCDWNDVLVALHAEGLGVTGAHLTDAKQDPRAK